MLPYAFPGALALLAMLHPIESADLLPICLRAVLLSAPALLVSLFLKQHRAEWGGFLAFGDMLPLALPISAFCAWPELAVFAVCHHLSSRFVSGWLLRRAGVRNEKNFTLILAYRQTIKHHHRFPNEIHPRENPLFQPARNAQHALVELLPLAGLLLGLWLNRTGLCIGIAPIRWASAILTVLMMICLCRLHRRRWLPSRMPTLRQLLWIFLRAAMLEIGCSYLPVLLPMLSRLFTIAECRVILLCAMFPVLSLPDELCSGETPPQICDEIRTVSQWAFIFWLITAALAAAMVSA